MLGTPKFTRTHFVRGILPDLGRSRQAATGSSLWKGFGDYGRLAGSHEYSPGVAVPGSESGHALQVCRGTKDSRFQAGQPLALQEVEARSVDGREVQPDGSQEQEETEGGCQSCRASIKRRSHVWIRIENDCWPGCGVLEH